MPRVVASAKQLAMMQKLLDAYCETYRVTDHFVRKEAAAFILELFNLGFREEDVLLGELTRRRA
jgi:hypothetical protein